MKKNTLFFQDKDSSDWLDEKRFNELFAEYWRKLFGFCRHHVRDTEVSKEIVQQVFLSLWERRKQLDIKVNIGHYLFGAVRLCIAHHFREESYRQDKLACNSRDSCDITNNTEETIHFEDLNRYIESLVVKLPCRCRQVYTLSRNNGLTIPEIANELDISVKTTEAHLTKALKFLRTKIELKEI
ncbi:RNA polymerase sigma-70 factor [Sphingobacterium corticibacterium]|uniref:RNA polymerase sigma-70 factor n=1 Tax=Sphingobacterium corticibacterium TaxID=2484746 RepID=UPI0013EE4788|nr:RNA polymerase sigma-70 factor [Sphingobacterium corticibacterium]